MCTLYLTLRRETSSNGLSRAKRCSIQAARRATGGSLQNAEALLSFTRSSLQAYLHRAKQAQSEILFDFQREPD